MSYTNWDFVDVRTAKDGQRGLFARRALAPGTVLGAYDGRAVLIPASGSRLELEGTGWKHSDLIQLARIGDAVLALAPIGAFEGIDCANHSCRPNAELVRGVVLRTIAALAEGDEITWDYRSSDVLPEGISCWCEEARCTI